MHPLYKYVHICIRHAKLYTGFSLREPLVNLLLNNVQLKPAFSLTFATSRYSVLSRIIFTCTKQFYTNTIRVLTRYMTGPYNDAPKSSINPMPI